MICDTSGDHYYPSHWQNAVRCSSSGTISRCEVAELLCLPTVAKDVFLIRSLCAPLYALCEMGCVNVCPHLFLRMKKSCCFLYAMRHVERHPASDTQRGGALMTCLKRRVCCAIFWSVKHKVGCPYQASLGSTYRCFTSLPPRSFSGRIWRCKGHNRRLCAPACENCSANCRLRRSPLSR